MAAAGGVGSIAVQLAKLHGATVIGTASANHVDYVKSLGADQVIDHNATRFEEVVHGVDLVLDLVGDMGDGTQSRSWQVLKPGGLLASLAQFPSARHRGRARGQVCFRQRGCRRHSAPDRGPPGLSIPVSCTFLFRLSISLKDISKAHEQSEGRHVRGKIVLQVADL